MCLETIYQFYGLALAALIVQHHRVCAGYLYLLGCVLRYLTISVNYRIMIDIIEKKFLNYYQICTIQGNKLE